MSASIFKSLQPRITKIFIKGVEKKIEGEIVESEADRIAGDIIKELGDNVNVYNAIIEVIESEAERMRKEVEAFVLKENSEEIKNNIKLSMLPRKQRNIIASALTKKDMGEEASMTPEEILALEIVNKINKATDGIDAAMEADMKKSMEDFDKATQEMEKAENSNIIIRTLFRLIKKELTCLMKKSFYDERYKTKERIKKTMKKIDYKKLLLLSESMKAQICTDYKANCKKGSLMDMVKVPGMPEIPGASALPRSLGNLSDAADEKTKGASGMFGSIGNMMNSAKEKAEEAKQKLEDAKKAAEDKVNEAKEKAEGAASQAKKQAEEATSQAKKQAEEATSQAKDAVKTGGNKRKTFRFKNPKKTFMIRSKKQKTISQFYRGRGSGLRKKRRNTFKNIHYSHLHH